MTNDILKEGVDAAAYVQEPLRIASAEAESWDDVADVVVAGFGGAGACAALEARSLGADVLVLERFEGGGATVLSGGVYYGGGTRLLREAGFNDTPETMYRYLKLELGDVVRDETLHRFCEQSSDNLEWLSEHGIRFGSRVYTGKTSYPPPEYDLYYSGNERGVEFRDKVPPAPRGHRPVGHTFTSGDLYKALHESALAKGVRVRTQTRVTRLLVDADGKVIGVEVSALPPGSAAAKQHRRLIQRVNDFYRYLPPLALRTGQKIAALEREFGHPLRIRARHGVILTTGSFAFNRAMVRQHAPKYIDAMPIGTIGCDGSGIKLGRSLGAATGHLEKVSAWRTISPPLTFVKGIVVNRQGRRFATEETYLGKLGYLIAEHQQGHAWVILDRKLYTKSFADAMPGSGNTLQIWFPLLINLLFNKTKGRTLAELAERCSIDAAALEATVAAYNADAATGQDALGKSPDYTRPLGPGPYYAIDISIDSKLFPCPTIPMGALAVDEDTGNVLRADGTPIVGLYAAGRAAVGLPSGFYVSGLAIADCVFSGRRAGRCIVAPAGSL